MLTSAVLPPLTRELKLPDWTAGAIFSLSAAIWVVTAPYWGGKSNAWGRRRVAAIGDQMALGGQAQTKSRHGCRLCRHDREGQC